jgi:hypothetical protein
LPNTDIESLTISPEEQELAKFAIFLSRTWLGRIIMQNQFLKAIGKRLLNIMTN